MNEAKKKIEQWLAAWVALPLEQRALIMAFCVQADADVADAVLAVRI